MIRNCIPAREKSRPAYSRSSRDMKELSTKFNEFFTEVGVRAAEEAKILASVNGLITSHQELPVSFIPEDFDFGLLPLSRSIGLYSHFLQTKHQGKTNYTWQW